jgi:hypothetical protein
MDNTLESNLELNLESNLESNFISLELPLEDSPSQMQHAIEIALKQWGDPLRWAVTAVDRANQMIRVEAIVTQRLTQRLTMPSYAH